MSSVRKNNLHSSQDETDQSISNNNAKRILSFIREGEQKLSELGEFHNAIILVGITGTGKTTLAHLLTGKDLSSHEIGAHSGEFIIGDKAGDIKIDCTVIANTSVPQIFRKGDTIVIDLAGFEDVGRNEAYDMAASYYMKKVLEKTKNIKILLVTNYHSVRKGVSRNDFPLLLQHASVLMKNIEPYLNSMALVVTKVDNVYVDSHMVSDNSIINNVADFLREVETSLNDAHQTRDEIYVDELNRNTNELIFTNSIKILHLFKQKNNANEYSRLSIVRRPNAAGSLSKIQLVQDCLTNINKMLEQFEYTRLNINDFDYTISSKSKYIITDIFKEIIGNINDDFDKLKTQIIWYYEREISRMSNDKNVLENHLKACSETVAKIRYISGNHSNMTMESFVFFIRSSLIKSCKQIANSLLDDIIKLGRFLNFLGDLIGRRFNFCAQQWITSLQAAITYVENLLAQVSESIKCSATSIFDWIMHQFNTFVEKMYEIFESMRNFASTL